MSHQAEPTDLTPAARLAVLDAWRRQFAKGLLELPENDVPPVIDSTALTDADRAWAAGLFVGEGYCGVIRRGKRLFMNLSLQMLDERSVARFGASFGLGVRSWPLHYDKSRLCYRVNASGRTAERLLSVIWPYIEGTAKGDQVQAAAEEAGVFGWINGSAGTPRAARDGGNQWRGRKHTPESRARIAASQRARWERKKANGG